MMLLEGGKALAEQADSYLLTILTFLPMVGALFIALFVPGDNERLIKQSSLVVTLAAFIVACLVWANFDTALAQEGILQLQLEHFEEWIPSFGVNYHMGIDGISLILVILTAFLTPIVMVSSGRSIHKRPKEYFISMLVLQTGMFGAFCAFDMFLFYVFFEIMLIPMYLLIGVWGGEDRVRAAVQFFLYTLFGSLLMFVAILYCYAQIPGDAGFSVQTLTQELPAIWRQEGKETAGLLCFFAFMLSFAIKTPVFPFHTWLPLAHTEAPTGGSVILAGVLLKLGTYGMVRFGLGFFPEQCYAWAPLFVALAVIGIIYGAMMAIAQDDLKKLVAYSSVSHLGFVVLGIFAFTQTAVEGALLQNINHGLATGLLFLCVGYVYDRRHTREIEEFGGLAKVMPKFATVFMIATLASIGLPGLNGFVGEFMILIGSFGALEGTEAGAGTWDWMKTATLFAGSGVILGAVYMLWAYQRVIFGPLTKDENRELKDLDGVEIGYAVPLIAACFVIGVQPGLLLEPMEKPVQRYVEHVHTNWSAMNSAGHFEADPGAHERPH